MTAPLTGSTSPQPTTAGAAALGVTTPSTGTSALDTAIARAGGTAPPAGNAGVATSFTAAPAASAPTGSTASRYAGAVQNAASAPTSPASAPSANAGSAAGGGLVTDIASAALSGVQKIVSFAQNGMNNIEQAIQADMNAGNGTVDAAKMQQYTMKIQQYQTIMEMAAKIEEKKNRTIEVWLQSA